MNFSHKRMVALACAFGLAALLASTAVAQPLPVRWEGYKRWCCESDRHPRPYWNDPQRREPYWSDPNERRYEKRERRRYRDDDGRRHRRDKDKDREERRHDRNR